MPADIPLQLKDWYSDPALNVPAGGTLVSNNLDDNLRTIMSVLRMLASTNSLAGAATTDLGAKDEAFLTISGAGATISSFGTFPAGMFKFIVFGGVHTLVHNATSLKLPGAANITTAADDAALMLSGGSGNWRCLFYSKANGYAINTSVAFTDGAAAAPGGYFSSDTNNGLYRIGADNWALSVGGTKWVEFSPLGSYVGPPVYTFGTSLSLTTAPGSSGSGVTAGSLTLATGSGASGGGGDIYIRPGDANGTIAHTKIRAGNSAGNTLGGGALSLCGGDTTASPSGVYGGNLNLWAGGGTGTGGHGDVNVGFHSRTSYEDTGTILYRVNGKNNLLEWNSAEGTGAGVPRPAITSGAGAGASIVGTHNAFSVTFGTGSSTTLVIDLTTKVGASGASNPPIPTLTFQSAGAAITYRISALSATSMTVVFASAPASGDKLHAALSWYF